MPAPSTRHIEPLLWLTPEPPVNITRPSITTDFTPTTGEEVAGTDGTWSGSPSLTYQYTRNGADIAGATAPVYTLQGADEGQVIRFVVTATNSGGVATATSDPVTPGPTPPLAAGDIVMYLSGGSSNTVPAGSIGGARSSVVAGPDIWDPISPQAGLAGQVDYRLIYPTDTHAVRSAGLLAWVALQEAAPGHSIAIGAALEPPGTTVPAIPDRFTAPSGVVFTAPTTVIGAVDLGTDDPQEGKGLWLRRTIDPNTPAGDSNPGIVSFQVTQL